MPTDEGGFAAVTGDGPAATLDAWEAMKRRLAELAEAAGGWLPLDDRVLVRPLPEPTQTEGGLYLASGEREVPQRGEVVAVGPGRMTDYGARVPLAVLPGDEVLYGRYAGTAIEGRKRGEELIVLRETDLLARRARAQVHQGEAEATDAEAGPYGLGEGEGVLMAKAAPEDVLPGPEPAEP